MKLTKQILGIVALGAMALTQTACQSDSDFLKEHSYKQDDSGMFNTENEVAMAINSCYKEVNYLVLGQTHGYHSYMLTGVGLDTYTENNNNDCFSNWTKLNSANGYSRHWYNELYYLVNYANTAIYAIETKDIKYTTAEKKNELLGEARFMRGWHSACSPVCLVMCLISTSLPRLSRWVTSPTPVRKYGRSATMTSSLLLRICLRQSVSRDV